MKREYTFPLSKNAKLASWSDPKNGRSENFENNEIKQFHCVTGCPGSRISGKPCYNRKTLPHFDKSVIFLNFHASKCNYDEGTID
jgi:hypothetical protein